MWENEYKVVEEGTPSLYNVVVCVDFRSKTSIILGLNWRQNKMNTPPHKIIELVKNNSSLGFKSKHTQYFTSV